MYIPILGAPGMLLDAPQVLKIVILPLGSTVSRIELEILKLLEGRHVQGSGVLRWLSGLGFGVEVKDLGVLKRGKLLRNSS